MTTPLPEGVTKESFMAAVARFSEIVGERWVVSDEGPKLTSYNDHYPMRDPALHMPSAAVAPKSREEIQQILAVARDHEIPLWTVSTGRNYIYGGPAPRKAGTVVLDLKRMNRIIEVNEELAYAVVEPGVSYFDLYNHLRKIGSRLWIDCPAPGWGGIIGNTMDRGVGYTPYGEHFMMQSGLEVILADGTVVTTGTGAIANSTDGYVYQYGHGPSLDGMFTMANYGIVTRMGVHLMPDPGGYRPYMVTLPREEDVELFTDLLRPLKLARVIPNAATTVELILEAAITVTKADYHRGKGPLPDSARKKMMSDLHLGAWNFYGALYGPRPVMDNNWRLIKDAFSQIPGARFYTQEDRGHEAAFGYRAKLMRGVPNMTEFSYVNWVPNGAHAALAPMAQVDGKTALDQYWFVREKANHYGFDYLGEYIVGWRDMHHIFCPVWDKGDSEQRSRIYTLMNELVEEGAEQGFANYRTHLDLMDQVAATFSWNDHALMKLSETIKDTLDPGGILAPGKSGVWPSHMRAKR